MENLKSANFDRHYSNSSIDYLINQTSTSQLQNWIFTIFNKIKKRPKNSLKLSWIQDLIHERL